MAKRRAVVKMVAMERTSNEANSAVYDMVVVGGGPAGATAALYAARADLHTLVVDKGLRSGALGMAGSVANYPGVRGPVSGAVLVQRMRDQAQEHGAEFVQDKAMASLLGGASHEIIGTLGSYRGRSVVVATGSMGRTASTPGEERLVGKGVAYCATCDAAFFRNRDVAVVGTGEEAVEECLLIARFSSRVHLIVPAPALKVDAELAEEVADHPHVRLHRNTRLEEIIGEDKVEAVRVTGPDGESELRVDGVFIYLQGGKPVVDYLGGQLELTGTGCIRADEVLTTSVPGVFAAGDVLCRHLRQAVAAAAQGAQAAMAAERYLSGRARLRPDWG